MKKFYLLAIVVFYSFVSFSQNIQTPEIKVEKSIFSIQTGFLGFWANNELRLTNSIALRTELGLDSGIFGGTYYENNVNFILYPTLTLEPRFYYNIKKRAKKGKSISNNSANFLTTKLNYIPDWFVISNYSQDISVAENFSALIKWGLKRSIGKHFTYETGIGLGYRVYFLKQYGFPENESEAALDLHFRIGYVF